MPRYPSAIWKPTVKCNYGADKVHLNMGVVLHSAEGSAAGLQSVIDGPREASWHFEVHKDGQIIQRVDSAEIAWTNGSYESNRRYWGIEHEGSAPEPLTEAQFQASYELVKWLFSQGGITEWERGNTLWEHRELGQFGSAPTSCPGGRIPWARYKEDDMMTDQQIAEAIGRIARAGQLGLDKGIVGTEKLLDIIGDLKTEIAALKAAGGTAPHKHSLSATITGETEVA